MRVRACVVYPNALPLAGARQRGGAAHVATGLVRRGEHPAAAGPQGYSLRIRVYPHQILRENKQATGAGADRVSQGMRCAFGKNVGTAARVQKNQKIITIQTNEANFSAAKDALRKANCKLPSPEENGCLRFNHPISA